VPLRRLAQQYSTDAHIDPVKHLYTTWTAQEVNRAEADISGCLRHFLSTG